MENLQIKQEANGIAEKIKESFFPNDNLIKGSHIEHLLGLFRSDESVSQVSSEMSSVLLDVLSVMSDPEIAIKLQPCNRGNFGKAFRELIEYFELIGIVDDEVQAFKDYTTLKYWCGSVTKEDLAEFKEKYN